MGGLLIQVLWFLVYVAIAAVIVYVILYVFEVVGIPLPAKIAQLLWLIFGLICLIALVSLVLGSGMSFLPSHVR